MRAQVLKPFISNDGRLIVPRNHYATFNGLHNIKKTTAFIVLYHHKNVLGQITGLTAKEIVNLCGVKYISLLSRIRLWAKWGYVSRKKDENSKGRIVYRYRIEKRGEYFIEHRVPNDILKRLVQEIKEFQKRSCGNCPNCKVPLLHDDEDYYCISCSYRRPLC